ncbi:YceI family protein [Flectobacillus longus]|uniref:YceI family protein n=1 Tax=Flectobacillus longus TaxID=2984207 RepID=UPI0024B701DD|nr:YceI family protein [Flectobacillus longus]MDI9880038.1 YceI family protein [Flectobacillus longus]
MISSKIRLLVYFIISWISIGTSYSQVWHPVSSNITFKIKMLGAEVFGKMSGFQGAIHFDPEHLAQSSIYGSVETNTIDTDNSLRNRHLKEKEGFFEVVKYPTITMKSLKIEANGENFVGTFALTMKGVTKNIRLPFSFINEGENAIFKGSTIINRRDWQVGGGTIGMSEDVEVSIVLNVKK